MSTQNGTPATAIAHTSDANVREYLNRFRGRDPQEMLGLPRESKLTGAIVIATVVSVAALAALTLVPYFLSEKAGTAQVEKVEPAKAEAPKAEPLSKPASPAPAATIAKGKNEPGTPSPAVSANPAGPDVLKKMGEGDIKTASPKLNPLDKKDDLDFLKDLGK